MTTPKISGLEAIQRSVYHESLFCTEMLSRGFTVLTCYGNHGPLDAVVMKNGIFIGVQIKGTSNLIKPRHRKNKGWRAANYQVVNRNKGAEAYHRRGVDVIAAYVDPFGKWWLIPAREVNGITIRLNPASRLGVNRHAERWEIFDRLTMVRSGEDEVLG